MAEIFVALMLLPLLAVVYDLCFARQDGSANGRRFNLSLSLRDRVSPRVRIATRQDESL